MEIDTDIIYEVLANDQSEELKSIISNALDTEVKSKQDWDDLVTILQVACSETFQKHWLKTNHTVFSIFEVSELLGVDCIPFNELRLIETPRNFEQVSNRLFYKLIENAKAQFLKGGSTLFFNVGIISSTRSAIIAADLIDARYRETIHVLNEIDELLPSLTKEWVNVSRLWRTGNGYRILKARSTGQVIHVKEYEEIRNLLAKEMKISSDDIARESIRLRKKGFSEYLQFSKTFDEFVTGLIASRGVRGTFESHFKAWIDHEGLDEF
ncbi:MAG: hypothetical protein ACFFE6_06365 [Candidatus Thorarchaeota archaeon]